MLPDPVPNLVSLTGLVILLYSSKHVAFLNFSIFTFFNNPTLTPHYHYYHAPPPPQPLCITITTEHYYHHCASPPLLNYPSTMTTTIDYLVQPLCTTTISMHHFHHYHFRALPLSHVTITIYLPYITTVTK